MNLQRADNQFLVIAIFVVIGLIIVISAAVFASQEEKTEEIPVQEWCEIGTRNEDGSVTYVGGRNVEDLMVLATGNGQPVLMAKCDK